MDSLGAIMLGNEPALKKYMTEKPRRRDENIVSRPMMSQICIMGAWLVAVSFAFLKLPFFAGLFENHEQHLTGYFVLFIVSALFNGGPDPAGSLPVDRKYVQLYTVRHQGLDRRDPAGPDYDPGGSGKEGFDRTERQYKIEGTKV